jgi:hypothetical protein
MHTLSSSFACAQHRTKRPADEIITWAGDLIARPQRYGADERTRAIVRDLLVQAVTR